jgi:hypothetical protein
MSILKEIEVIERDVVLCDDTGKVLSDEGKRTTSGWAVIRLRDGKPVAHFQSLRVLLTGSEKTFRAAWDTHTADDIDVS